ncbi:MAG: pilus assembly protein N-terminal domain-containing protein, partial [Pseudomonadota bacterium]
MAFPEILRSGALRLIYGLVFLLCLAAPLLFAISPAKAASEGFEASKALRVIVDKAKVVRIAKPADTVIIGNPSIVDATIQDARTLVLTGRNFGITNLIVLDADGDVVVDETVVVQSHETNMVRIYRQANRETLACAPVCENTVTVGDE